MDKGQHVISHPIGQNELRHIYILLFFPAQEEAQEVELLGKHHYLVTHCLPAVQLGVAAEQQRMLCART